MSFRAQRVLEFQCLGCCSGLTASWNFDGLATVASAQRFLDINGLATVVDAQRSGISMAWLPQEALRVPGFHWLGCLRGRTAWWDITLRMLVDFFFMCLLASPDYAC